MPAIGPQQPRDHVEDARLAGARRAEQRGQPRTGGKARGEDPVAEAARHDDINRHGAALRNACGGRAIRKESARRARAQPTRSEENTSELQSLMRSSNADV